MATATDTEMTALIQELAARKAARSRREVPDEAPATPPQPQDWETVKATLADLLQAHGIDPAEPEALLRQLGGELADLPRSKPLLTVAAAFGLGFALGRMSK